MSLSRQQIFTAWGCVSPVGLTAESSCAALRAGIGNKTEIGNFGVTGENFSVQNSVGGRVPLEWLNGEPAPEDWPGHNRFEVEEPPLLESIIEEGAARMARLIPPALADIQRCDGWPKVLPPNSGIYLGLDDLEDPEPIGRILRENLVLGNQPITFFCQGRASALAALHKAQMDLQTGVVEAALVGGIDSRIRPEALEFQNTAGTLPSAQNSGIIPGEGAAFVLLENAVQPSNGETQNLCRLRCSGISKEPTAGTDTPNQAKGLTEALRSTVQSFNFENKPPLVICDLNGDRYRALEWGMASPRVLRFCGEDLDFWHPADCIGDAGAAYGMINLTWGLEALKRNYANHSEVLVWGASDSGLRAAAIIDRPNQGA